MKKYTRQFLLNELKRIYKETNEIPSSRTFHIHQNTYRRHFGCWTNACKEAGVPLRKRIVVRCKHCNKHISNATSQSRKFCNNSCSAKHNNSQRPKKRKTKKKVPTAHQKWIRLIDGPYCKIFIRKCQHCQSTFMSPKKLWYCSAHKHLYSTPNRDRFRFTFNIFHYPDLFDLDYFLRVGWYDGTTSTLNKLTRDHRVSVNEAIQNEYDPYYITHPLNCELMSWSDNSKKKTKSSITYQHLVKIVNEYDSISGSVTDSNCLQPHYQ